MIPDERYIEIIAKRMEEECGWSKASVVLNHYSWVDVATHLFCEKGLRGALLDAYKQEILESRARDWLKDVEQESYNEWKADVATRGGA